MFVRIVKHVYGKSSAEIKYIKSIIMIWHSCFCMVICMVIIICIRYVNTV